MIAIEPGAKWTGREISPVERFAVAIRCGFHCVYCGEDLRGYPRRDVTMDHLTPRILGGQNVPENLVLACRSCNSRKCHRDWRDYAPGGAIKRIERLIVEPLNLDLAQAFMDGAIDTDEEVNP